MRGIGAPVSSSAVPPNSIREAGFYGFVDCLLQSPIRYDKHLRGGAQLLSDVEENVIGMKFRAVNFPGPLLPLRTGTFELMPPHPGHRQGPPYGLPGCRPRCQ